MQEQMSNRVVQAVPRPAPAKKRAPLRVAKGRKISFTMPLAQAMLSQRAIRRVTDEPVSDELLLQLLELGTQAPSAFNAQNWEFIIVRDMRIKKRLARLNRAIWPLLRKVMRKREEADPELAKVNDASEWGVDHFEDYPVLLVACYRSKLPVWPPVLASTAYASLMPALQNILLAARSTGLGANLTTTPLWSTLLARLALGIPWSVTPAAVISLGWPAGNYGPVKRRPVGYSVSLDRYDQRPWFGQTAMQVLKQARA